MSTQTLLSTASPTLTYFSQALDSNYDDNWTSSRLSQALFYLAIVVGVLIALLFIFFLARYFVRARLGVLLSSPISRTDLQAFTGGVSSPSHIGAVGISSVNGEHPHEINIPEQPSSFSIQTPRTRTVVHASSRLENKFSKKFRLSLEELEYLFPERSYSNWLDGGAEKDAFERDIHGAIKYEGNLEEIKEIDKEEEKQFDQSNFEKDEKQCDQEQQKTLSSSLTAEREDELHSIYSTKSIHLPPQGVSFDSESCAICLEDFENNDIVRGLICRHVFHKDCIDRWMSLRKACCPLCKRDYYMRSRVDTTSGDRFQLLSADEINKFRETEFLEDEARRNILHLTFFGPEADRQEFLNSLRPLEVRALEVLETHPEYEELAENRVNERYFNLIYRIFWRLMGISKKDLIYSIILSLSEEAEEVTGTSNNNNNNIIVNTTTAINTTVASSNGQTLNLEDTNNTLPTQQETENSNQESSSQTSNRDLNSIQTSSHFESSTSSDSNINSPITARSHSFDLTEMDRDQGLSIELHTCTSRIV